MFKKVLLCGLWLLPMGAAVAVPLSSAQMQAIQANMLANIATPTHVFYKQTPAGVLTSIPGAVLASPSLPHAGFSQDYQFNWVRDSALTMQEVITLYQTGNAQEQAKLWPYLLNYVAFANRVAHEVSNLGFNTLGQPKINIDGSLWQQPWARPQNDGAALQAIDLIQIAKLMCAKGDCAEVRRELFNPDPNAASPGVLKMDLDYVAAQWSQPSYGVWEEVKGTHFFVLMVQRKALVAGAEFAKNLGDSAAAAHYQAQIPGIDQLLKRFWNPALSYLPETLDQQFVKGGGLDSTVMLAALYGESAGNPYPLTSPAMLSTVAMLRNQFAGLYPLNWSLKQGVWLGRYPNDIYDGNTFLYGNPWILITAELGEFYARAALQFQAQQAIVISPETLRFWRQIAPTQSLHAGEVVGEHDPRFQVLIKALHQAADAQLQLIAAQLQCGARTCDQLSEQVDRLSGRPTSASDLTWSSVAVLRAWQAKGAVVASVS